MGNVIKFPVERTAFEFASLTPRQRAFVQGCAPERRQQAARMAVLIEAAVDRARTAPAVGPAAMEEAVAELERMLMQARSERAISEDGYLEFLGMVHAWAAAVKKEPGRGNARQRTSRRVEREAKARASAQESEKVAIRPDSLPGTPDEDLQDWMANCIVELLTPKMGAAEAKRVVCRDNPKWKPSPKG